MNYFESRIEQNRRRLEKIESNPEPGKLRCNKILYELEIETTKESLEAWKSHKPFACGQALDPLFSAMGFEPINYMAIADRSKGTGVDYFEILRKNGYPENTCDRTVVAIGLCLNGDLPYSDFVVSTTAACNPEMLTHTALANAQGSPHFRLDIPLDRNYEAVHYLAEQFAELIQFAEARFPGIKYEEEKLAQLLDCDGKAIQCLSQTYELRKKVPSPISGQDAFRIPRLPSNYSNPAKGLAYIQMLVEELSERAARGVGAVPDEKLRVAWLATGPFSGEVFSAMHKKGASIPWFHFGAALHNYGRLGIYGDEEFGRKLTPLEELARMYMHNSWSGRGMERWVPGIVDVCRDLNIDAVIDFLQIGCFVTIGLAKVTKDTLREELGIPTLDLEGRELEPSDRARDREFVARVEEFIDVALAEKGKVKA